MENEITFTDINFDEQIKNGTEPILVDFWAPWCMPCRVVSAIISELAQDNAGQLKVGKLNVDENPQTASRFAITSIPTLILFKEGQQGERWVGAMLKPMLEAALKPHLPEKVRG